MYTWRLQVVFEVSAVYFKANGSTSHTTFCRTRIIVYVSIAVTADRSLATNCLIVLGGNESMFSFKCPYVGKPIGIIYGRRKVHTHGLPRPIHVSGFVAFIHCQTTSSRCARVLLCLKYLCLRAGGRSSRISLKNSHIINTSLWN